VSATLLAEMPVASVEDSGRRPEHALLLSCARTHIDHETDRKIRRLLAYEIDWEYLLRISKVHQVAPLLGVTLCGSYADACPDAVVGRLRSLLRANASHNLWLADELLRVLDLFGANNIRAIPYKGPLLASLVYGDLGLRLFSDLDILVHEWEYHIRVPEVLLANGWSETAEHGYERSFKDPSGRIKLDVHQGLTPQSDMPFPIAFDTLWKHCISVPLLGRDVRTLADPDLLLVLCVQLAKDMMKLTSSPPLIKICDIAELVSNRPGLDWNQVLRQADKTGSLWILYLGLRTAQHLFGVRLPPGLDERSRSVPHMASLVSHVEESVLDSAGRGYSRPELRDSHRWHSEVRERLLDRQRTLRLPRPTPSDYAFIRLPRAWSGLYYFVRPVRLICRGCAKLIPRRALRWMKSRR
jgi:hypothetical protein